ncbi:nucleoredoxin-like [Cylas formicarius]|uniref:nucleoredoxin-like n=1 Tax=Cylas formicarius TaxID=197179 RepID=UPI002958D34F|nr:nucleoredoxin-like [Cylas formicarius]XP_060534105.1 nucleoredoxin-like [Cylas formicarius]XP_060534107.1 nucleoredoxin-like [Cylas formicarius]
MSDKSKWCDRLFGKRLIKCDSTDNHNDFRGFPTCEVLKNVSVTGVYFSFANINSQCDDFLNKLRDLYEKLNTSDNCESERRLEVIQVVMWAHNDNYGDFEMSHRDSLLGLPWFAMPFSEIDLKTRLSRRYRIKSGVPTLVLLDKEGATVSVSAQEKLLEDPNGTNFPWRPRPVDEVLKEVVLQPGGRYFEDHQNIQNELRYRDLSDGVRGFYFSAHWCPPCRAFTPQLADAYKIVRKREPHFEIIFVSSDRSIDSYNAYLESMPWLSVPFQHASVRAELAQLYGIRGIPTLLLLDSNGHVITMDARAELAEDPLAQNFPWKPRPVNVLTDRFLTKLHDYPAIALFVDSEETEVQFAESVLLPAASNYYKVNDINFASTPENRLFSNCNEDDYFLQFLIGTENETTDILRDLIGLDDVVPLLVAIDLPSRRYATMEYGIEITTDSVNDFVTRFQRNDLKFKDINEEGVENAETV